MSKGNTLSWSRVWLLAWCALSVLHVTQAIWFSGWRNIPGDMIDGRFNNLVLEHGFQTLRGKYDWLSPGQFYPEENTLGYSDTHAGTLPLYVLARWAGASMENAYQAWFVAVALLNAIAAARLFAALRLSAWLAGPSVFLTVAPAVMVWLTGTHMQMLPMFPALFAFDQIVRFGSDRRKRRLLASGGWFAWQFAASPYSACFASILAGLGVLALLCLWRLSPESPSASQRDHTFTSRSAWWSLVPAGMGGLLGLAAVAAYFVSMKHGHIRPWSELTDLSPDLRSWFSAPPVHRWFPVGWPGGAHELVEHGWLSGFWPWGMMFAAIAIGWRHRADRLGRAACAAGLAGLLTMLLFTRWTSDGAGGFLFLAHHIEALRAFRATGRVIVFVNLAQAIAAAVVLALLWNRYGSRRWVRWACLGCLLAGAAETLAWHQPSVAAASARARSDAVVAAWRAAGDRPILLFAPGFSNQPVQAVQLDAWSAALRLKRCTFNGYSGGVPGSHFALAFSPTIEVAHALLQQSGVPAAKVSVVESWAEPFATELGIKRSRDRPLRHLDGFDLQPTWWKLPYPPEPYVVDGLRVYQFDPPGEVHFKVPAGVRHIDVKIGFRPGCYDEPGKTDGVAVTWAMRTASNEATELWSEYINPYERPPGSPFVNARFDLPAGKDRVLILRTSGAPTGRTDWDWIVFGDLQAR